MMVPHVPHRPVFLSFERKNALKFNKFRALNQIHEAHTPFLAESFLILFHMPHGLHNL